MHGYVCAYPNEGCSVFGRDGNPIEQPRGGSGIGVGEGFGGTVFGDVALQEIGAGEVFLVVGAAVAVGIVGLGDEAAKDALGPLGEGLAAEG